MKHARVGILVLVVATISLATGVHAQCVDWFRGGTIPEMFAGAQRVDALATYDAGAGSSLYAAGDFVADGQLRYGLYRWDGASWGSPLGLINGTVLAMTVWNGDLYIGGTFTQAGGIPASRIVRFDGTEFHAMESGVDRVTAMTAASDGLYVAAPTRAGVLHVNNVARWDGATWSALGTPGAGRQTYHRMAYDSARQRVVLFGRGTDVSETYEWDGTGWTLVATGGPSDRRYPAMAYDAARGVTVLFGGISNSGVVGDTWEWDGVVWTQRSVSGPSPRYSAAMAYDTVRGRIVMNGGRDNNFQTSGIRDTWEYDGVAWTQVSSVGPEARSGHAMAYHAGLGRVALYGGTGGAINNWMWLWDGAAWTPVMAGGGPGARPSNAMVYDSSRGRLVMFASTSDVWEWNGSWSQNNQPNPPAGRQSHAAAYDAARGCMVVYGGDLSAVMSETLTFTGTQWAAYDDGVNEISHAIAAFDDGGGEGIFVAGQFNRAGTAPAWKIARFRAGQWAAMGSGPNNGSGGGVSSLAVFQGELHVGGTFNSMSGIPTFNLAKWTGAWSAFSFPGLQGGVSTLTALDLGSHVLAVGAPISRVGTPSTTPLGLWNGSAAITISGYQTATPAAFASFEYDGQPAIWMSTASSSFRGLWVLGAPCVAPTITQHPAAATGVPDQPVQFQITATGTATLSYQWRRNGVAVTDLLDKRAGSQTRTLVLYQWSLSDAGEYDCVVTNSVGSTVSDTATLTVVGSTPGDPATVQVLAATGQPVPGRPGLVYSAVATPLVSPTGAVAFISQQSGAWALSRWTGGAPTTLMWSGMVVPDGAFTGTTLQGVQSYSFGADDGLFVNLLAARSGSNFEGVWNRPLVTPLEKVAAWNDAVAAAGGGTFTQFNTKYPIGGDGGHVGFETFLRIGAAERQAYIVRDPSTGELAPLAITGNVDPATGLTIVNVGNGDMVTPSTAGAYLVSMTSTRRTVIAGNNTNDWGYWVGAPGSLTPLVVRGEAVPGRSDGAIVAFPGTALQSDTGFVAFGRQLHKAPNIVISQVCLWKDGVTRVLVESNQEIAPGQTVESAGVLAINDAGDVIVRAQCRVAGQCCNDGYWLFEQDSPPGSPPTLIALQGEQPLLGLPAGFDDLRLGGVVSFNARGMVVLQATITGMGDVLAVLGWTRAHGLFPILVPGTQVLTAPGEYRTVYQSRLSAALGNLEGPRNSRSINDDGRIALWAAMVGNDRAVISGEFADFLTPWFPCAAVIRDPRNQTVDDASILELTAVVTGVHPTTFRWMRDGVPLADGGRISGATTTTLRVAGLTSADGGAYRLFAEDQCGEVSSADAYVTVRCRTDFNRDGFIDFFDYDDYVACYETNLCPEGSTADFNGDGFLDFFDYDEFVAAYEGGC